MCVCVCGCRKQLRKHRELTGLPWVATRRYVCVHVCQRVWTYLMCLTGDHNWRNNPTNDSLQQQPTSQEGLYGRWRIVASETSQHGGQVCSLHQSGLNTGRSRKFGALVTSPNHPCQLADHNEAAIHSIRLLEGTPSAGGRVLGGDKALIEAEEDSQVCFAAKNPDWPHRALQEGSCSM